MGKAQKSSSLCYEAPGRLLRDGEAARKEINVGGAPAALRALGGNWDVREGESEEKVRGGRGSGGHILYSEEGVGTTVVELG
jgi:hypothetical protein